MSARLPCVPTSMKALRFAVVGAGGVVVNVLVLHGLYVVADLPLLVAAPVAVALAVAHNYLVNNRWTFGRRRASLAQFGRFGLSSLTTMTLNVAVVWALVGLDVHHLLANLAGIAAAAGFNFGASTTWVWRERPGTGTSTWAVPPCAGPAVPAPRLPGDDAAGAGQRDLARS
ncbi:GtrA family protein [Geodermatophilus sp. SYSU D00758]